jgi:hypothetical protein
MPRSMTLAILGLAGTSVILATEVEATLPEADNQVFPAARAELSSETLSPKANPRVGSSATKAERSRKSRIDRSQTGPPTKHGKSLLPVPGDTDIGTASASDDAATKGRKMTVIVDEESGIEYFCHHSRKRLWVRDKGWVIRRVPSCF